MPRVHCILLPRPDCRPVAAAAGLLRASKRQLIVSGGVRCSGAEEMLAKSAIERGIPVAEAVAGKARWPTRIPAHVGQTGVTLRLEARAPLIRNSTVALTGNRIRVDQPNLGWIGAARRDRIRRGCRGASGGWLEKAVTGQIFAP